MRLITILNLLSLLFTPIPKTNYNESVSINAREFVLTGYDDYYYNTTNLMWSNVGEKYVDYSYFENSALNYTYMVYPFNLSSDTYDVYTIFVDFPFYYDGDIQDILIDNHIFELNLFYLDSIPFTNSTNTLNFFKSIDNMGFDYYLNYDSNTYNGLINYDTIHSYISFDNYINSESNLFIIMRLSNTYYQYVDNMSDTLSDSTPYYSYLSNSNGFYPLTYWYNINISLSSVQIDNQGYTTGFNDGVNSVDTDIYYQQGVDSVNVDAIYANAFNDGYNVGITESSHDYGIGNLLYSIFDIPIMVMSSLFSFTIFGAEVWGLLVSLMFISFILYVIVKILKPSY